MGQTRKIADIHVDEMSREGQGIINLQYGSNKGANQAGSLLAKPEIILTYFQSRYLKLSFQFSPP